MEPILNSQLPEFSVQAFQNGAFKTVTNNELKGKWAILFFYPADFTFVCPTELVDMAEKYDQFKAMGVEIYSVSTDSHFVHKAWHDASESIRKIQYPMLADPTGALCRALGVYIEEEAFGRLMDPVVKAIGELEEEHKPLPSPFEIETAISFLYYKEKNCDFVLLECGMGGKTDATNVIRNTKLAVITSISMDHMGFLGDTLAEIAACKAGIIKPDTTVVSMRQQPEAMEVIRQVCQRQKADLRIADAANATDIVYGCEEQYFSYGGYDSLEIHLAGSYQIANAVLAVEAVKALIDLGYAISEEALRSGLQKASWKGRFTVLQREPYFIIDGAHNRDGAKVLADSVRQYFPKKRLHYIMGVFKDKEYETIIDQMSAFDADVITVETPGNPRALPAEELAEAWKKKKADVTFEKKIENAVRKSLEKAKKDDVILAFGSLSFLGEIVKALDTIRSEV